MKTKLTSNSFKVESLEENKHTSENDNPYKESDGITLSTFPLTDLVYEVLRSLNGSYLQIKVMEAELVVLRSDRELIGQALTQCLNELTTYTNEKGTNVLFGIRIYGKPGMGYIDIECPGLDLTDLSVRTGKSALSLTGHVEPAFGFVIAQAALARVKSSYYINHNRNGGSNLVFEIPKVRGEAS